jgi:hypothetical protein
MRYSRDDQFGENYDRLVDLMEPRERVLFELLENQMALTRLVMRALILARWWAVICSFALTIALLVVAWALVMTHV